MFLNPLVRIFIFFLFLGSAFSNFITQESYSTSIISSNISQPRGLLLDSSRDILVLGRGQSSVYALYPNQNSAYSQALIVNGSGLGLNHGLAYFDNFLYASSGSTVYRWPYVPGQRTIIQDPYSIVISNISVPDANKQNTRTLLFDSQGLLYVTINSDIRIELDSSRCRIRRFNISDRTTGPIDFEDGELFADGVRNEVGLAFDCKGVLWGVENAGGVDYLIRDDLGGNIHEGNPAEEINKFDRPSGTHYGYPYCFASYDLKGYPVGSQFAWPTALEDGVHTDEWCRREENNEKAKFFLPAHQAPLGIEFFCPEQKKYSCGLEGAFPCSAAGSAIIAFHGSMNISTPVGYKVSLYNLESENDQVPTAQNIVVDENEGKVDNVERSFRPVNAIFDGFGHLIVSADSSDQILRIAYKPKSTPSSGNASKNYLYCLFICLIVLNIFVH